MATRVVQSEAEAAAVLAGAESALRDMRPFWDMLERQSGALEVGVRKSWEQLPLRLSSATVEARRERRGYYENPKASNATNTSPLLWTGSVQRSAMKFTGADEHHAFIDPDLNYEGPLEGVVSNPFSDIVGHAFPDERIWDDTEVGDRIARDLSAYLFKVLS